MCPEKGSAARAPPVHKVLESRYIRVGASLFMYQDGVWVQEMNNRMGHDKKTSYWDQISFRHPYRLRSRTKVLESVSRPIFTRYLASDTDDSTTQQTSDEESDSDFDESAFQQFSDEESELDPDEQQVSELDENYSSPESLASYSEDTTTESGLSEDPCDTGIISEDDGQSSSELASDNSSNHSDKHDDHGEWP